MDRQTLRFCVREALAAIEKGTDINRAEIATALSFVLGHTAADAEVEAAITQLRLIPLMLDLEERVAIVLETLDQTTADTPFLHEQQESVAALFRAAETGEPLSLGVRHDFGLVSSHHVQVLLAAIRQGRLARAEALACIHDGARLTAHLAGTTDVILPLRFKTTDHNGMPQTSGTLDDISFGEATPITTPRGDFLFALSNESELRQAAVPEHDTLRWLQETLTADSVLYDIGANVGYYALFAAATCPGVRVFAFEPAPLNVARLNTNIQLNRFGSRILAFPVALSDTNGIVRFGNTYLVAGGWSHSGIGAPRPSAGETFYSGCVSYTLDDFMRAADFIPPPTHLKVDVDGPELRVLRGATATLTHPGLRHLLIEMRDDQEAAEAEALLGTIGFRLAGPRPQGFGNRIFSRSAHAS
ncbi:MAG: FkbM family methyltransferase [Magnetococcales bacterium]|nr:FkbM family methyltransferase [Magnetococcales bacterium]